jgi:hypothetical protein
MEQIGSDQDGVTVRLHGSELLLLNNALNGRESA